MTKPFLGLKNRKTAILLIDKIENVPNNIKGWKISDLDEFFANEADPQQEWISVLFSSPILGIKSNLANIKENNVGLSGEILNNEDVLSKIISNYTKYGYDIIVIKNKKWQYLETNLSGKVKISFN